MSSINDDLVDACKDGNLNTVKKTSFFKGRYTCSK